MTSVNPLGPAGGVATDSLQPAADTSAPPSHEDQARFAKALENSDKERTHDAGDAESRGDAHRTPVDTPSSLFRRREAPGSEHNQEMSHGGDTRSGNGEQEAPRASLRRGQTTEGEPLRDDGAAGEAENGAASAGLQPREALGRTPADRPSREPVDTKADDGGARAASDTPSSLFRRRETPGSEQGQRASTGGDTQEGKTLQDATPILSRSGPTTDREPAKTEIGDGEAKAESDMDETPRPVGDDRTPPPSADMLLRSLAMQSGEVAPTQEPPATQRAESSLSDLVREVADRIMVGESGPAGQQEVRIILKDEVLGGTEVRITEHEGSVQVTFVAGDKDAELFLEGRREEISAALGKSLDRDVRIEVTDRDGGMEQADRQSREDQGQPNDGRSRNRRSVNDERKE